MDSKADNNDDDDVDDGESFLIFHEKLTKSLSSLSSVKDSFGVNYSLRLPSRRLSLRET